jgi:hypothetical protein
MVVARDDNFITQAISSRPSKFRAYNRSVRLTTLRSSTNHHGNIE